MNAQTIAIISVGATLLLAVVGMGGFIMRGQTAMGRQIEGLAGNVSDLRESMARLEGLFEGFTKREGAD